MDAELKAPVGIRDEARDTEQALMQELLTVRARPV
jgi:hypothetical protein